MDILRRQLERHSDSLTATAAGEGQLLDGENGIGGRGRGGRYTGKTLVFNSAEII